MHEIVQQVLAGEPSAFSRLERELCRGAALREGGLEAAEELARASLDTPLGARCFARLTLGNVDWLEIHGADGVGTPARALLDARKDEIVARAANSSSLLWLATVAGQYEAVPKNASSAAGLVAEAHRVRAEHADSDEFMQRAEGIFLSSAPRELRLAAAIAWCLARPGFGEFSMIDGKKDVFLQSVPKSVPLADFPFRLGDIGALAFAVGELTTCSSWERREVGDDPHFRWDPQAKPEPPRVPRRAAIESDETNPYMLDRPEAGEYVYTLAGLDAVDWKSLEDAYGHAGAVPTFLQSLASSHPEEREWALHALFAGINHQGSTYSASVAAIPFLVTLVSESRVPDRGDILRLLVGLATGEPRWALLDDRHPTPCQDPLSDHAPRLIELLGNDDDGVRSAIIHLLGHLPPAREVILPALAQGFEREADPYLRASLVLAMARASAGGELSAEERALVTGASSRLAGESSLGHAVAAMCPFYLNGALTEAERTALHAIDESRLRVQPGYVWNGGFVGKHAREMHKLTMPAREALEALERGEWDCQARARESLFVLQTERPIVLLLPEQLSPDQLRYLRLAVKHPQAYYDGFWRDTGLPQTEIWLGRFLGNLPAGALDRRVRVNDVEWPLWNVLYAVLNDQLPVEDWIRIADNLSDDEMLAVYDDGTSRDLQLDKIREYTDSLDDDAVRRSKAYRDRLYRLLLDQVVARTVLVKEFERRADALLSKPLENASYLERTLLFAGLGFANETEMPARFAKLAQPGDWSPAMTHVEPLRWGLARLPLATRWEWFRGLRLVSLTRIEDARGVRHKVRVHDEGWQFLDLIPTPEAAAALKDALAIVERHRRGEDDPSHELGHTSGPLINWANDDELPRAVLQRIAESWGPLYPA
jgi:hypothetical protein